VENLLYLSSNSTDGAYNLTATFKLGTNLDNAQVLVRTRGRGQPQLPPTCSGSASRCGKASRTSRWRCACTRRTNTYDRLYMSNYACYSSRASWLAFPGVGDLRIWGAGLFHAGLAGPQKIRQS